MYRASAASKAGVQKAEIAKDFSYPKTRQFLLDRASQNLRRFDSDKLRLSLQTLAEADKSLKTFGTDPRTVLEQLTVKLVYIIAKGEAVD